MPSSLKHSICFCAFSSLTKRAKKNMGPHLLLNKLSSGQVLFFAGSRKANRGRLRVVPARELARWSRRGWVGLCLEGLRKTFHRGIVSAKRILGPIRGSCWSHVLPGGGHSGNIERGNFRRRPLWRRPCEHIKRFHLATQGQRRCRRHPSLSPLPKSNEWLLSCSSSSAITAYAFPGSWHPDTAT